jgi:hypothetical protein
MHGVIEEWPLLVVDAQAIVDEADIDGVAARRHQHRLEARWVERLLGGGEAWRERQDQKGVLRFMRAEGAIDAPPLSSQ